MKFEMEDLCGCGHDWGVHEYASPHGCTKCNCPGFTAPQEPVSLLDRVKEMSARDSQVAGDHYRQTSIQPWDVWEAFGLDAFLGAVVKYILRAGRKGSKLEDLKKARHTLDRAIEIEEKKEAS